ncbi:L-threonine aldolase [Pustulibacterium marinum]|uniref:L-threonine aldolase n=1 Tax=Pustulibacterium marinum TaxID=1224947 RepID=A0A1I7IBK9_9FLAO|nr:GntG family PLP-dependent aldolase [Pustulibacterium marinum]SFU70304.1 L-threonine aldolase [Pustulibacterium marinum]
MKINLISDTVTKPTSGMFDAMMKAEVGDDMYREDPTTIALEEKIADMFGMEAAMFFPSGTMANQTAIKLHTNPGDQLICDKDGHIFHYESGGVSFNSGVSCRMVDGNRGVISAEQVEEVINDPNSFHSPYTSLVSLENTSNKGGGTCYDFEEILKIKAVCDRHNLKLHLDGARLWNAMVAKNETPQQYGEVFDSISVCLSKGLGCPVGSVLMGTKEFINRAFRVRKLLGGAMRQIGYVTAAGIYALDNHIERLADDHQRAQEISTLLQSFPYVKSVTPVETNIVIFELDKQVISHLDYIELLQEKGISISTMGPKLRIVTHLDYTAKMHQYFLETVKNLDISVSV